AVHLYRIAQEATTNAIKHGKARKIGISLTHRGKIMTLRIKDDGVGFPQHKIKKKGMGLRVMQHRARMIGATLDVQRGKNQGTTVTCTILDKITLKRVSKKTAAAREGMATLLAA
ncbi:MAG: ATP-binding protein, partial [Verrucomicrobiota bacterium]